MLGTGRAHGEVSKLHFAMVHSANASSGPTGMIPPQHASQTSAHWSRVARPIAKLPCLGNRLLSAPALVQGKLKAENCLKHLVDCLRPSASRSSILPHLPLNRSLAPPCLSPSTSRSSIMPCPSLNRLPAPPRPSLSRSPPPRPSLSRLLAPPCLSSSPVVPHFSPSMSRSSLVPRSSLSRLLIATLLTIPLTQATEHPRTLTRRPLIAHCPR